MERTKPAASVIVKLIWVLVAAAVLAAVVLIPLPDSVLKLDGAELTQQGRVVLGVLLFCLLLWIAEPIPFHIAGLVGMILLALLKAESFVNVVRLGFGNDTVLFFIGVLALSAAITKSGLGRRVSMLILRLTGNKTSNIILGFLVSGALIGMWITTLAAAAMLMPLARSIAEEEGLQPGKSRFGKALFIAVAWGALIGGAGSPAGGGANNLAIGFVRDTLNIEITFAGWMLYGVPCMLLLLLPAWWILRAFFKPEIQSIRRSSEALRQEFATLPKMTHNERSTMIIFLLTVVLWLVSKPLGDWIGVKIPTSLPAVLGACLFFVPGVTDIQWKDVESDISWSGILLIASGISLGMLVYQSGAAQWLAMLLLGNIGTLPVLVQIISVILIVSILKLGLSSNTVTATVVIPIMIAVASQLGLSPLGIVMPAAMTLNIAFILVTSTPTSVIPYSTGYFSIADMAKSGVVMTLVAAPIMTGAIYLVGKLAGIY